MKPYLAAHDVAQGALACAAAAGSWLAFVKDLALELLGVPLPVVLLALTGAAGARFFSPPSPFWPGLVATSLWTIAGCGVAQLALWGTGQFVGGIAPAGALAGVALLVTFFGPTLVPVIRERGAAALARWFDSIRNGGGHGNG